MRIFVNFWEQADLFVVLLLAIGITAMRHDLERLEVNYVSFLAAAT